MIGLGRTSPCGEICLATGGAPTRNLPVLPATQMPEYRSSNYHRDDQQEIDLGLYWRALLRHRGTIYRSIAVTLSLALLYLFLAVPKFTSNVLLQSEPNTGPQIGLTDVTQSLESSNDAVLAGIEILSSRRVVGRVVDELHLDIVAVPSYLPVVGAGIVRVLNLLDDTLTGLRPPVLGLAKFAWGGERIVVERFDLPRYFEDTSLPLIAGEGGRFQVFGEDENLVIDGAVGTLSSGSIKVPGGDNEPISILVKALVARPGTKFSVTKLPRAMAVEDLQEDLVAIEVSADSGVIDLSLEGADPELVTRVLTTITDVFLTENVQRKQEQLDRMLAFVNSQLPIADAALRKAEQQVRQYHQDSGSVDVQLETSTLLDQLTEKEQQISAMELLQVDYEKNYTKEHPNYVAFENKILQMKAEKELMQRKLAKLPDTGIRVDDIQQNLEIASNSYLLLLEKQQEINIIKAGVISDAWVVDPAQVPIETSSPLYLIVPIVAVLLGGFVGVVLVLFTNRNIQVVESPTALNWLKPPLLATVPHSKGRKKAERRAVKGKARNAGEYFLPLYAPGDPAVEGLRGLRASLLFSLDSCASNVVILCSPRPGSGNSFLSLNTAYLLAEAGKNVAIVDADMRRGHLHTLVGRTHTPGLSDVIAGDSELEDALQDVPIPGCGSGAAGTLSLLSRGRPVTDPTRMLIDNNFRYTIDAMQTVFEIVLIDPPPLIGFADASIITKVIEGANILVVRSGQLVQEDIETALERIGQGTDSCQGVVFNDVPASTGS
jgi:tyrosine-protein kinase Etk/Wzc